MSSHKMTLNRPGTDAHKLSRRLHFAGWDISPLAAILLYKDEIKPETGPLCAAFVEPQELRAYSYADLWEGASETQYYQPLSLYDCLVVANAPKLTELEVRTPLVLCHMPTNLRRRHRADKHDPYLLVIRKARAWQLFALKAPKRSIIPPHALFAFKTP